MERIIRPNGIIQIPRIGRKLKIPPRMKSKPSPTRKKMLDGTGIRFPRKLIDFTFAGLTVVLSAIWWAIGQNQVVSVSNQLLPENA